MTSLKKSNTSDPQIDAEHLKSHVKMLRIQYDPKTILLVDQMSGKVQEPTLSTISLIGGSAAASLKPQTTQTGGSKAKEHSNGSNKTLMMQMPGGKRLRAYPGESASQFADIYKCTVKGCGKEFGSGEDLKAHMSFHESSTKYVCTVPWCQRKFNYRHNLQIHMRVHNDERPYDCPQNCGKKFRTRGNMMDHLRRHYAVKPYKCDNCGQSFYRNNILRTHQHRCLSKQAPRVHAPAPFQRPTEQELIDEIASDQQPDHIAEGPPTLDFMPSAPKKRALSSTNVAQIFTETLNQDPEARFLQKDNTQEKLLGINGIIQNADGQVPTTATQAMQDDYGLPDLLSPAHGRLPLCDLNQDTPVLQAGSQIPLIDALYKQMHMIKGLIDELKSIAPKDTTTQERDILANPQNMLKLPAKYNIENKHLSVDMVSASTKSGQLGRYTDQEEDFDSDLRNYFNPFGTIV